MPTPCTYNGSLTREQFLLREMRVTARTLIQECFDQDRAIECICADNLYQYPTEREQRSIARACIRRLMGVSSDAMTCEALIDLVANGSSEQAAQAVVYALMCDNLLVWEFMTILVAERYSAHDLTLTNQDITSFVNGIAASNETVAGWSDATRNKIRQVLNRMLVDAGFKENVRTSELLPVYLDAELAHIMQANGDAPALAAFGARGEA